MGLTMLSRGSTAQVLQWLPEALLPQPGPQSPPADLVAGEHTSTIGITLSVIRHAYTPFIAPALGTSLLFQSLQPYPAGTAIRGDLQLMVPQQRRDTAARWPRHTVGGSQGAMAYLRGRCDRGRYASPSLLGVCSWGAAIRGDLQHECHLVRLEARAAHPGTTCSPPDRNFGGLGTRVQVGHCSGLSGQCRLCNAWGTDGRGTRTRPRTFSPASVAQGN